MRVLLSVLLLSCLFILAQASWNRIFTQTLDSDLDEQLCPSELHRGTIIDIHESMERGAELMDGLTKGSVQECMAGCCASRGCDLALFKNEGLSKTGKNCYYVHCGGMENCVLVEHSAFTSVVFKPRANPLRTFTAASRTSTAASRTSTTASHTPSQTLPTTSSPVPAFTTTPTPVATEKVTSHVADDTTTTVSMATTTEAKNSKAVKKLNGKGKVVADKGSVVVAPSVSAEKPESKTGENGPCGEYGCDGSGVVAVVVVAVICFAIVLVVVAIMVKKAVDKRRKRKFRNVDYLINGMYT